MKKWFIGCIAALSIAPAFAVDWQYLSGNQALGFGNNTEGTLYEFELSSVKVKNGLVYWWSRYSYLPAEATGTGEFAQSMLMENAGNCRDNESETRQIAFFSELRGKGKHIRTATGATGMESPIPGSTGDGSLDLACRIAGLRK